MIFMQKVIVLWCWTTCNLIQQIESQYNSVWQQQQQYYWPSPPSQQQLPINQRQQRTLVKISASGFLPFENDILPYAVLQRILAEQEQQWRQQRQLQLQLRHQPQTQPPQTQQYYSTIDYSRGGRYMQWQATPQPKNLLEYAKNLQSAKVRATIKNQSQRQSSGFTKAHNGQQYYYNNKPKWLKSKKLKLQRTADKSKNHFKLYDADGEYLLDLRYHNDDEIAGDEVAGNGVGDGVRPVADVELDSEWSADTKNLRKIKLNENEIGTTTSTTAWAASTKLDEGNKQKPIDNYNKNGYIDEPNNNHLTLGKSTPISVKDNKTDKMPTSSSALPTTADQKRVQHIWLHL